MKPLSILVVDDHEPTRRVLQLWLETHGHSVVLAPSGNEALKTLAEKSVDLVVTDVLMPDGNGIELITALRKTRPGLRVLAISGGGAHVGSSTCLQRAHNVGAHALLLKPFKQDQLQEAMRYVMGSEDDPLPSPALESSLTRRRHQRELRLFEGLATPAETVSSVRSRESL